MNTPALEDLRHSSLLELETLYAETPVKEPPRGCYQGLFLQRLDTRTRRKPLHYVSMPFGYLSFGIDFESQRWFFYHRRIQAGLFTLDKGPSRWRDTETFRLHYAHAKLPGFVKDKLYDEVKPLSDQLALGLGGVNRGDGGDHFYFALVAYR